MRLLLTLFFLMVFGSASLAVGADVGIMSKDELKPMLGNEDVVVLDVRAGRDWSSSEFKIKGAERVEPGKVSSWAGNYDKNKTIVLYCA